MPLLGLPSDLEEARSHGLRRAARHSDEALSGTARIWLRRLPRRQRPLQLCERYPRVANRIAFCWHDAALAEQALDDLLVDRRGGRRGFPLAVVRELQRLREFNRGLRAEVESPGLWHALGRIVGLD
jgi:hypothetical protein